MNNRPKAPTPPWKSRWMNPPLTIRYGYHEKRKKVYESQHQTAADFFDKISELKQYGAYIDAENHDKQMARIDELIMEHEAEQVRNALDDEQDSWKTAKSTLRWSIPQDPSSWSKP